MKLAELETLADRAKTLQARGDLDGAEALCREALALDPDNAQANNNLGGILLQRNRLMESEKYLERAASLQPEFLDAHLNLGRLRVRRQDWMGAQSYLERALEISPNCADARVGLGLALFGLERFQAALDQLNQAAKSLPRNPRVHYYRGLAFQKLRHFESAKRCFERTIELDPAHALGHFALAYALIKLRRLDEAEPFLRRSLELDPKNPQAIAEMGMIELCKGRFAQGASHFEQALALDPQNAGAHFYLGLDHLMHGRFDKGWKELLWVRKIPDLSPPDLAIASWDGQPDPEATVLLRAEQGFGDMIQLVRYASMVKERVGQVFLECPAPLRRALAAVPGVDEVIELGNFIPEGVKTIPLFNLPALFETKLETIPWNGAYIRGDFPMRAVLREFFPRDSSKLRVGLVWQGNPEHPDDKRRSMPAELFARLARVEGVEFFSLQKGFGAEQTKSLQSRLPFRELGSLCEDFADTASVIQELDLVLGVDTSVIHLAGAMGKPAWAMLSFLPEWRWMLHREDSPWYPSLRLFRQKSSGDWEELLARVAAALRELAAQKIS